MVFLHLVAVTTDGTEWHTADQRSHVAVVGQVLDCTSRILFISSGSEGAIKQESDIWSKTLTQSGWPARL